MTDCGDWLNLPDLKPIICRSCTHPLHIYHATCAYHVPKYIHCLYHMPIMCLLRAYPRPITCHLVRIGRSPAYLADMMMTATANLPVRERLRSANSFRYEPHNWNSNLVSEVSRRLDQRLGTLSHLISKNSRTLKLSKNNWKLTYLRSLMNDEYWLCWCTTTGNVIDVKNLSKVFYYFFKWGFYFLRFFKVLEKYLFQNY